MEGYIRTAEAADEADVARLRVRLDELARENAALRSELRAHALPTVPSDGRVEPVTRGGPRVSAARRWLGRAIGAAMLAAGFGLGVWYARDAGRDVVQGWSENYDPGTRTAPARPAAPPPPPAPSGRVAP